MATARAKMIPDRSAEVDRAVEQLVPDGDSSFVFAVMGIRMDPHATMHNMHWQKALVKLWLADRAASMFPLIKDRPDILRMIVSHGRDGVDACATMPELDLLIANAIGQHSVVRGHEHARADLQYWYHTRYHKKMVAQRDQGDHFQGESYNIDVMAMAKIHELLRVCNHHHLPPLVVKSILDGVM